MSESGDLESRVSALEGQVEDLNTRVRRSEHDAAAARVLAGGADRDVADLGGEMREFREQNNRVLNAMRADLTDLRERVETGFARVDGGFSEMRARLDGAAAGQARIVELLDSLIEQRDDPDGDRH